MADDTAPPVFRANKRRKIYRQRAGSDASNDEQNTRTAVDDSHSNPTKLNSGNEGDVDLSSRPAVSRVYRPKKRSTAFTSSESPLPRPQRENDEDALVPAESQSIQQQNDRFVRPNGNAVARDDKHMYEFIDSKLAETRYTKASPNLLVPRTSQEPSDVRPAPPPPLAPASPEKEATPHSPFNPPPATKPTSNRRHGRPPRAPSPSATARASLIDQIMRESNHAPHYTSPNVATTPQGDNSLDSEAAAAAAFRAEFLAQAEARNLSKRQPASNASTAAAVPSGPKLGGGRSAREKMRLAQEAKGKK